MITAEELNKHHYLMLQVLVCWHLDWKTKMATTTGRKQEGKKILKH